MNCTGVTSSVILNTMVEGLCAKCDWSTNCDGCLVTTAIRSVGWMEQQRQQTAREREDVSGQ